MNQATHYLEFDFEKTSVSFPCQDSDDYESLNWSISSKEWATCRVKIGSQVLDLEFCSLRRFQVEVAADIQRRSYWVYENSLPRMNQAFVILKVDIAEILAILGQVYGFEVDGERRIRVVKFV